MKVGRRKTIIEGDGRRLQRRRSVYENGAFRTGEKKRRERRRADLFGGEARRRNTARREEDAEGAPTDSKYPREKQVHSFSFPKNPRAEKEAGRIRESVKKTLPFIPFNFKNIRRRRFTHSVQSEKAEKRR